jgi:SAM-dependent methyltransferase
VPPCFMSYPSLVIGSITCKQTRAKALFRFPSKISSCMRSTFSTTSDDDTLLKTKVKDMQQRFTTSEDTSGVWESLWKEETTPWDLNAPTAALRLELNTFYTTHLPRDKSRLSVLVPGCGAGYDLVSLQLFHDDLIARGIIQEALVVGLDVSETSLLRTSQVLEKSLESSTQLTRVQLVHGDFFDQTTWKSVYRFGRECEDTAGSSLLDDLTFDLIFDYTFFCAIPPYLRADWGESMCKLLDPTSGQLLTLMYPVIPESPERDKGPPFPVLPEDYECVLAPLAMESGFPRINLDTHPRRVGKELACWWSWREGH